MFGVQSPLGGSARNELVPRAFRPGLNPYRPPGETFKQSKTAVHYNRDSKIGHKRKGPPIFRLMALIYAGNDLLSHTVSRAVQSALRSLTAVFGMGTGVTSAALSPTS
jgi:hypothetical protein